MDNSRIFSVTEINASIRGLLESQFPFVSVAGEISNLRQPLSGHLYFTLKDEQSQIKAVLFKIQRRYLPDSPLDGQSVVCRGRISVYEPRGDYQLIVDAIDFHGAGTLQLEFDKLKKKLAAEGLFDPSFKKPIPLFPHHIVLITSPKGAAVHDFIRIAQRRNPNVHIAVYPVAVQGNQAPDEIVDAIASVNQHFPASVIVLCRGGGSLEDLWAFNEEKVARAIAASRLPIVSAVGHEIDFTIADFVADLRAPTPSAAAELILPDTETLKSQINQFRMRLIRKMTALLDFSRHRIDINMYRLGTVRRQIDQVVMKLDHAAVNLERLFKTTLAENLTALNKAAHRLQHYSPATRMQLQQQKLADLNRRLLIAERSYLDSCHESLTRAAGLLDAVSPLGTLARGYSIVKKAMPDGRVITAYNQLKVGDRIDVILYKGYIECTIEKTGESRLQKTKTGRE